MIGKPYTQLQLAQKIRGVLWCDGTAVRSVPSDATAILDQPETKDTPKPKSIRILICEDDALIRLDLAEELRDAGYEVLEAANAREALNFLKSEPLDLLITDVGLPDRSGEDLAQDAREISANLPLIFATGGVDVPSAITLGNCKVLSKPFGINALRNSI